MCGVRMREACRWRGAGGLSKGWIGQAWLASCVESLQVLLGVIVAATAASQDFDMIRLVHFCWAVVATG